MKWLELVKKMSVESHPEPTPFRVHRGEPSIENVQDEELEQVDGCALDNDPNDRDETGTSIVWADSQRNGSVILLPDASMTVPERYSIPYVCSIPFPLV